MHSSSSLISDIFNRYSDDILKYSLSILKDQDEAKDAVQEIFIRYINSRDSFRGDCSEKTWLLTITRNYCFKQLSKTKRNSVNIPDDYPCLYDPKLDTLITLKDAINNLASEEYELIYMREYAGYSYQEISDILQVSLENVKIRLFRVRQKLKQYLNR